MENLTKLVEEEQYEILDEELAKLSREGSGEFVNSFLSAYVPREPHFIVLLLTPSFSTNKQMPKLN